MNRQAENARTRAAGMAFATRGRNTRFKDVAEVRAEAEEARAEEAIAEARRAENRYCPRCEQTTRHDIQGNSFACQRCGSVKYPVRFIRSVMA